MKDLVTLKDKSFKPYLTYDQIQTSIDEVAARINEDYASSEDVPMILCVLNGAMVFTADLLRRLTFDCELISIKVSSYTGTTSGEIMTEIGLTRPVKGRKVIVVEDIVDTGKTVTFLKKLLKESGAADVRICTMLLKPEVYKMPEKIDYVAKEIGNDFIVGFGLDYDELGRNLKDIYVINE